MPPLAAIERFFERLFERPSARLFRARLQPVQLQRRIERAMEAERLATADRTLVPNRFVVHLNPADLEGFGDMTGSLASELADGALLFARARQLHPRRPAARRPRSADPTVRARRHPGRSPGSPTRSPGSERHDLAADRRLDEPAAMTARGTTVQAGRRHGGDRRAADRHDGLHRAPTERPGGATAGHRPPTVTRASVRVRRVRPDHRSGRRQRPRRSPTAACRATTPGSPAGAGTLVYADLGSTNGSRVNGVAVDELVLGAGDRIELGDTVARRRGRRGRPA